MTDLKAVDRTRIRHSEKLSQATNARFGLHCRKYGDFYGLVCAALQTNELREMPFKGYTLRDGLVGTLAEEKTYQCALELCFHPNESPSLKLGELPFELQICRPTGKLLRYMHDIYNASNLHLTRRQCKQAMEDALRVMSTHWVSVQKATQKKLTRFFRDLEKTHEGLKSLDQKDRRHGKNHCKHWALNRSLRKCFSKAPYTDNQKHYARWLLCGCYTQFFRLLDGEVPDPSLEGQLAMGISLDVAKKSAFEISLEERRMVANDVRRLIHKVRSTSVRPPRCSGKGDYFTFDKNCWSLITENGQQYIEVMNLAGGDRKKRLAWAKAQEKLPKSKRKKFPRNDRLLIPLKGIGMLGHTLRIYQRGDGYVSVHFHYQQRCQEKASRKSGREVGFDMGKRALGYWDTGEVFGEGLGDLLDKISDATMAENQCRQKIEAMVKKLLATGKPEDKEKAQRIIDNNLGTKKQTKRRRTRKAWIVNFVGRATNKMFVGQKVPINRIIMENLSGVQVGGMGKRTNRRLSYWVHGYIARVIEEKCAFYNVELSKVNPAYTSQMCSCCGHIEKGNRHGEKFKCLKCGFEAHADVNAAKNIRGTAHLTEDIPLDASPSEVRKIREEIAKKTK